MLSDSEIVVLKADEKFRELSKLDAKEILADLAAAKDVDFKGDLGAFKKAIAYFVRTKTIRRELFETSLALIEKIINKDLHWERSPKEVKAICESNSSTFLWMRYDEPRVHAVFQLSRKVFDFAEFRAVIKTHTSLSEEQANTRLLELREDISRLEEMTLLSIKTKGLIDGIFDLRKDQYYERNEERLREIFLTAQLPGFDQLDKAGETPKLLPKEDHSDDE